MSNIAASLSVAIRNHAEEQSAIPGTAWADEAYVRVEWPWLAFPGGLACLALLFLGIVIHDTCKKGQRQSMRALAVFKNDSLPVLLYGLDDAARQSLAGSNLKTSKIELLADAGGAKLSFTS